MYYFLFFLFLFIFIIIIKFVQKSQFELRKWKCFEIDLGLLALWLQLKMWNDTIRVWFLMLKY